jgi:hypothetical protein
MTNPTPDAPAPQPATITAEDMDRLITTGQARPWTRQLRGQVPPAVLVESGPGEHRDTDDANSGEWYVMLDGTDVYQPASPELAALLTRDAARLHAADRAVADVDARNGT